MESAEEKRERELIRQAADKKIAELAKLGALATTRHPETGEQIFAIELHREEWEAGALRRMRAQRDARLRRRASLQ